MGDRRFERPVQLSKGGLLELLFTDPEQWIERTKGITSRAIYRLVDQLARNVEEDLARAEKNLEAIEAVAADLRS